MKNLAKIFSSLLLMGVVLADSAVAQVGSCASGTANAFLSANNARARIQNNGGLFRGASPGYEIPKGSGLSPLFTQSLWVGGYVGSTLRVAASNYGAYEFWPGPVSEVLASGDCSPHDRIYRIAKRDFEAIDAGDPPSRDMLDWPYQFGAPVIDGDSNPDNYDLAAGDRPELLGEEMLFTIMNDIGNTHNRTGGAPLGVEVHMTAFSAASSITDIDNTTFYRYRIYNRNALPITEMHVGFFHDADLGDPFDDYAGSDPFYNLAYVYNSDDDDEVSANGYGTGPPAMGFQILGGSVMDADGIDNDNDGVTDEAGEQIGLYTSMTYSNAQFQTREALFQETNVYYENMRGLWRDGSPMQEGFYGWQVDGASDTRFMYNADPGDFWSELNVDGVGTPNANEDRRGMFAISPFDLAPGESKEFLVAVIYARGTSNLDSVAELRLLAGRLAGTTASSVTGESASTIVETPEPTVPAPAATGQPLDVTLEWIFNQGPDFEFEVQLSENEGFSDARSLFSNSTSLNLNGVLEMDREYSWRVRAFNTASYSPWSLASSFSTGDISFAATDPFESFEVVANSAGPLVPPDQGIFAFNNSGFPLIPCQFDQGELCDRPSNLQQTNGTRWGIHADGADLPYSSFVDRVTRNGILNPSSSDYEIRFTGSSLHYDRFGVNSGGIIAGDPVPFEVWNIGDGTPDNAADDYRMIVAAIDWEMDGWGLRDEDHPISGGANDPFTDSIYIYDPANTSPGSTGYNAWAAGANTDPLVGLGDEVIARLVFVNWNGGFVLDEEPVYSAELPEPGTIFRISTSELDSPILATPAKDGFVTPGDISFFWSSVPFGTDSLVVATDAGFSSIVTETGGVDPGYSIPIPTVGDYFWKVVGFGGVESAVWSFTVANTAAFDFVVDEGWNLLGIPFSDVDMSTSAVFGAVAGASARTFDGQYSLPRLGQVEYGRGYWVNYGSAGIQGNDAFLRSAFDLEMDPGWNLFAGPNCALPAGSIVDTGDILSDGTLWDYVAGTYVPPLSLIAGKGYWVHADDPGQIILDCSLAKNGKGGRSDLELLADFDSFRLTPDGEGSQRLYYGGTLPDGLSARAYSLPPMAPGQKWRAEFHDGRYITEGTTATINIDGAPLPIVIERGDLAPEDGLHVLVRNGAGGILNEAVLKRGDQLEIYSSDAATIDVSTLAGIAVGTESDEVPLEFALEQNYPNPFNPVTNIRFAIPTAENVTLEVVDLTGRIVDTLVSDDAYNAGWHNVTFDAKDLASGVYFYRITTQSDVLVRSMVLLK